MHCRLTKDAHTLLAWALAPATPCSVDEARSRLIRSFIAMSMSFYAIKSMFDVAACSFTSFLLDFGTLLVVYGLFHQVDTSKIEPTTAGDVLIWVYVVKLAVHSLFLHTHLFSLTAYGCNVNLPILSAFVSNKRTFICTTIVVPALFWITYRASTLNFPPLLDLDDLEGLYTVVASNVAIAILAVNYVIQVQVNSHALARSAAHIQDINVEKTTFIANLSHELRTPLHAILAAASFVKTTGDLTTDQKGLVNTILSSGDAIKALVGNILDLSHMDTNMLEWNCQTFDLFSLVEEVTNAFSVFAFTKDIQLQLHMPVRAPFCWQFVYTDQIRLKKVLVNLVDNAVKFCHYGLVQVNVICLGLYVNQKKSFNWKPVSTTTSTPAIITNSQMNAIASDYVTAFEADLHDERPYAAKIRFEVVDTGVGIDPKHISMIFEPFSLPFRLREGSGLGLSVSQRLVHGLGGHISVTSQLGEGSRFWFDLVLPVMECKVPNASMQRRPLAEADMNVTTSNPTGTGSAVPAGSTSACLELLSILNEYQPFGCFYFCDDFGQSKNSASVAQQLQHYGYTVAFTTTDRLLNPKFDAGSVNNVIVLEDQVCVLERLLPRLPTVSGNCGAILYLCSLGEESKLRSMPNMDRVVSMSKPVGPVKLLQSLQRLAEIASKPKAATITSFSATSTQNNSRRLSLARRLSVVSRPPITRSVSLSYSGSSRRRSWDTFVAGAAVHADTTPKSSELPSPISGSSAESSPLPTPTTANDELDALATLSSMEPVVEPLNATGDSDDIIDLASITSSIAVHPSPSDGKDASIDPTSSSISPPPPQPPGVKQVDEECDVQLPLPILIVEDNPINQMILKHLLESNLGLSCEIAENGRRALEAWSENEYSIIFMDIQMPVMDGFTAMREIRRLEQLEGRDHVWIVAMTGLAFLEDRANAIDAGCDEFLTKPVDMDSLQARVLTWLSDPAIALHQPSNLAVV